MSDLPLISIVVPSLNQVDFLAAALDSLLEQRYPALEIIVMDGGSTDGSLAVFERYQQHLTWWQSHPDGGQAAAINDGLRRASGTVLGWLNSDDLLCSGALEWVGRAALAHPDSSLFIGRGEILDSRTGQRRPFAPGHPVLNRLALRRGIDYLLQPACFFSARAWHAVGGLDASLHWCLDWDLFIRLADTGPAVLIDKALGVSREHPATKTATGGFDRLAEVIAVGQRHCGQPVTAGALMTLLDELLQPGLLDSLGPAVYHQLMLTRIAAGRELHRLAGRSNGFPVLSDGGDVPFPAPALPQRVERPRRGLLWRARVAILMLPVALGFRDHSWLLQQFHRLQGGRWRPSALSDG